MMGRIRSLLKIFCLDRRRSQVDGSSNHPYNQTTDVSHLASPPIAIASEDNKLSSFNIPTCERILKETNGSFEQENCDPNQYRSKEYEEPSHDKAVINQKSPQLDNNHPSIFIENNIDNKKDENHDASSQSSPHQSLKQQTSPSTYSCKQRQNDGTEMNQPQPSTSRTQHVNQNDNMHSNNDINSRPLVNVSEYDAQNINHNLGPMTKLSYDIISVREPLAKILAERQQNQRQILGDHDYIEVYGERSSSCFYEEIAGSTTSSATYDQIGSVSNHNYQVLVGSQNQSNRNHYEIAEDTTDENDSPNDLFNQHAPGPSTSYMISPATVHDQDMINDTGRDILNLNSTQSIPVYSVINKATRRSSAMGRPIMNGPPEPPPKNIPTQPSTSGAIQFKQHGPRSLSPMSKPIQLLNSIDPSMSVLHLNGNSNFKFNEANAINQINNIPTPPPRHSRQPIYNLNTSRPLPLPEDFVRNLDFINDLNKYSNENKTDTDSNGYELVNNIIDDDQADVGYEKIRDLSDGRGSFSHQVSNLLALENGGYESVHYSSSTALTEPKYEAITPMKGPDSSFVDVKSANPSKQDP